MRKSIIATAIILLFGGLVSQAQAQTVNHSVTWNANTEPDIASYEIYRAKTSNGYASSAPLATVAAPATSKVVTSDGFGKDYYAMKAVDTSGNKSSFSAEVSVNDTNPPAAPGNLKVTVVP